MNRRRHLCSAGRPSRWALDHILVTGSIARSASRLYLIYSEADFEVFRPAGSTRCTDKAEIWQGGGDRRSPSCQISHPSVQRQGCRIPKTEIFTQNRPKCGIYVSLSDFHKICTVCIEFQDALAVKIWLDLLEGLWSYGGFKSTGSGFPQIFSAPYSGKLCIRPPKVSEVQERARGPLSSCQVWWGSDFTCRRDSHKR